MTISSLIEQIISTHVPREGDDLAAEGKITAEIVFQPTSPARGTTFCAAGHSRLMQISTHVPREGDD